MTVGRLIEILAKANPEARVRYDGDDGYGEQDVEYVAVVDGAIKFGNGYGDTATFWHPGNGNLGRNVRLLGHEWPK